LSDIRANTISDAAGTGPIDLYKQSAAKAHFNHSQTVISESFNISSIEDTATGNVKGYYTSAMASSKNPLSGGNNNVSTGGAANYSTGFSSVSSATFYWVEREYSNGTAIDLDIFSGVTHGDLA
jgi:hypothetical protein